MACVPLLSSFAYGFFKYKLSVPTCPSSHLIWSLPSSPALPTSPTSGSLTNMIAPLVIISSTSPGYWKGQTAIKLLLLYFVRKWGSAGLIRESHCFLLGCWVEGGRHLMTGRLGRPGTEAWVMTGEETVYPAAFSDQGLSCSVPLMVPYYAL